MITLELTKHEKQTLLETLENDIADLRVEIGDTDRYDYRQKLKTRKHVLQKVVAALQTDQSHKAE